MTIPKLSQALSTFFLLSQLTNSSCLVPRYTNATIASCKADCWANQLDSHYYWASAKITATLTAATIVYVVDQQRKTTRTETVYNELPAGVIPPPTNAQGTHTASITVTTALGRSTVIELAYPTGLGVLDISYKWSGTLPTIDSIGNSICSTATKSQEVLFSSPTYRGQLEPTSTDIDDPLGHIHILKSHGCYGPVNKDINIDDAAPNLCKANVICGVAPVSTVKFLTETSVKYENDNAEAAPTDSPSPKKDTATKVSTKTSHPEATVSRYIAPDDAQITPSPALLSVGGPAVTIGMGSSKTAVSLTLNEAGQTVAVYSATGTTATSTVVDDIGGLIVSGLGATGSLGPTQFTGQGVSAVGRNLIATIVAVFFVNMLFII